MANEDWRNLALIRLPLRNETLVVQRDDTTQMTRWVLQNEQGTPINYEWRPDDRYLGDLRRYKEELDVIAKAASKLPAADVLVPLAQQAALAISDLLKTGNLEQALIAFGQGVTGEAVGNLSGGLLQLNTADLTQILQAVAEQNARLRDKGITFYDLRSTDDGIVERWTIRNPGRTLSYTYYERTYNNDGTYNTKINGTNVTGRDPYDNLRPEQYVTSTVGEQYAPMFLPYGAQKLPVPRLPCFAAGTQILMHDGTTKAIEQVAPGDIVMAFDAAEPQTSRLKPARVLRTFATLHQPIWRVGESELGVTPSHRFFDGDDGCDRELRSIVARGGSLIDVNGRRYHASFRSASMSAFAASEIKSTRRYLSSGRGHSSSLAASYDLAQSSVVWIEDRNETTTVYNFEVEGAHTYVAGGWRVHNDCESVLAYHPNASGIVEFTNADGSSTVFVTDVLDGQNVAYQYRVDRGANTDTLIAVRPLEGDMPESAAGLQALARGRKWDSSDDALYARQLGFAVGSFLSDKLLDSWGVDNVAVRLGIGSVTGRLGGWIGDSLYRGLSGDVEKIVNPLSIFSNFGGALITSAVTMGGAYLGRALMGAIGLQNDPLANSLASIAGGALAQWGAIELVKAIDPVNGLNFLANSGMFGVTRNAAGVPVGPDIGVNLAGAVGAFLGGFAGGKLGAALFRGDEQSIAIGSSIGAAIGGIAATAIFSGVAVLGSVTLGAFVFPFIGAFIGALLGSALGSLLGPKPSEGWADLIFENGLLQFGPTSGEGKALVTATKLAGSAMQLESRLIDTIGGRLVGIDALTFGMSEVTKTIYARINGSQFQGEAMAVLEQGALAQLRTARIAGGDLLAKQVFRNSDAGTQQELIADISLASTYALYDDNKALFEAKLDEVMVNRGGAGSWAAQKARAEGQLDLDGAFNATTYRANSQTPLWNIGATTSVSAIASPTGTPPTPASMDTASMAFGASLIAFDLNRDGVVAQSVEASGALFDIDGDGFKEQTGWLTPFDGFLVFDLNGNGQIDSVAEMVVSRKWQGAGGAMLGIELGSLDTDGDGYFDADDASFFSARLWTDRNLNGAVDLGELWSLTRFNIDHIALNGVAVSDGNSPYRDTAGNKIAWESAFGINGAEANNFGYFTTLSLVYNTKGVKTVVDPNHPGWFLLEHENGQKTAFGLGNTGLGLVGDTTFARTLFGTESNDTLTASDVAGAAAGVPGLFIDGKTGNDIITGSAADDVLSGGKGIDRIAGGDGNDVIIADEEDDLAFVTGGAGKDVLIFETADRTADHTPRDLILDISSLGFEIAIGGKGNDHLWASVDGAGIAGGEGDDTITGTAGADRLEGDEGNDSIIGGAGDDVLSGGAGVDALDAGDGNDILYVDAADFADGVQRVTGGAGQDTLVVEGSVGARIDLSATNVEIAIGGAGDDRLRAGAGADAKVLYGEGGDDTLVSGAGADEIVGGDGIDLVSYEDSDQAVTVNLGTKTWSGGHAAGDVLAGIEGVIGTQFVDTLTGDSGDNILEGGAGGDTIDGGDGKDTASYRSSNAAVQIDLSGAAPVVAGGHAAGDTLINIENVIGSAYADTLIGSDLDNVLEGGGGADILVGGAGNDTASYRGSSAGVSVNLRTGVATGGDAEGDQLSGIENLTGSRFDDVLTVGAGINVVDGGAGKDTVSYEGATAGVEVNLALGSGLSGDAAGDTYLNIENIRGGSGDDVLRGDGNANVIEGGDGNDTLRGGGGGDTLRGGLGNDTYSFGLGDGVVIIEDAGGLDAVSFRDGLKLEDVTIEAKGGDVFIGLKDSNKPYASAPELADRLVIKNGASDLARIERLIFATGEYRLQAIGADQERLVGSNGADLLVGDERNNTLEGGEGDDWLFGAAGDDWLLGGDGQDVLQGGEGRDWLFGGSGDDLIFGGAGDDVLIGGSGDDVLVGGPGNDQIEGGPGNDVLDGGEGDDVLQGGTGFDVYVQQKGGGVDRIRDEDGFGYMSFKVDTTFYGIANTGSLNAVFGNWANFIGITPQADPIPNVSWIVGNNLYFGGQDYTFGILPTELQGRSTEGSPYVIIRSSTNSPRTLYTPGYWIKGLTPTEYQAALATNFQTDWAPNRPTPPMPYGGINVNTGDTPEALMWGFEMTYYIHVEAFAGSDLVTGTEGADTLSAYGGTDKIYGYGGNDTLDGGEGNDALAGGDGNDLLLGGAGNDSIDGGRDNDTAYGGDGNDTLAGGAGDDLLYGEEGQDRLDGGSGADQLFGGNGNDQLAGGDGNDTLQGEAGDDKLYGDAGDDLLLGGEGDDELSGWDGTDRLEGGAGNDQLFGGNGDDLLLGQDGNDKLYGNAGKDRLEGGDGADELQGGDGNDILLGGTGDDHLSGGAGDDLVRGEDGADRLWGGDGQDRLEGGAGDDQIDGGAGEDRIYGGDGNDVLVGGEGADLIRGEAGDDRIFGGDGDDSLFGGLGNDTLSGWTGADILWGRWGDDALTGGDGNDRLFGGLGDDALMGGLGDDDLVGGEGKDILYGDPGNDRLFGGAGVDILQGGDGDDQLIGGGDIDFLYGGAGNDRLWGGADADVLSGGDGNDTLRGEAGDDQLAGDAGVDTLLGGAGNDALAGGADNDLLLGGEGADLLAGDAGDDELQGEAGNDELAGGTGNDRLFGGLGDDTAFGGEGDDRLLGGEGHDLLRGEAGNDMLWGEAGNDALSGGDGDDAIDGGAGDDTADGGAGNDLLLGDEGNDVLAGEAGADRLAGGAGQDTLYGGADSDALDGGAGDDLLRGEAGDDRMEGGTGNDDLAGGAGSDTFVFRAGFGVDRIADFSAGEDWIELVGLSLGQVTIVDEAGGARLTAGADSVFVAGVSAANLGPRVRSVADAPVTVDAAAMPAMPTAGTVADEAAPLEPLVLAWSRIAENAPGEMVGELVLDPLPAGTARTVALSDDRFEVVDDVVRVKGDRWLDHEAEPVIFLTVTVTEVTGEAPPVVRSQQFRLETTNVNEAPTWIAVTPSTVVENARGAVVGVLTASDPDAGDSFTYTASDERFEVVGNTLKLKADRSLDFEDQSSFAVTVTATDAGGLSRTQTLAVGVIDVAEKPNAIFLSNATVRRDTDGAVVGTVTATDQDAGSVLSYAVLDARFEIVGGQLKLKPGQSLGGGAQPWVELVIRVTDQTGLARNEAFSILLADANGNTAPHTDWRDAQGRLTNQTIVLGGGTEQRLAFDVADQNAWALQSERWQQAYAAAPVNSTYVTYEQEKYYPTPQEIETGPMPPNVVSDLIFENGSYYVWLSVPRTHYVQAVTTYDARRLSTTVLNDDGTSSTTTDPVLPVDAPIAGGEQPWWKKVVTHTDGQLVKTEYFYDPLSPAAVAENTAGAAIGALTIADQMPGSTRTYAISDSRFEIVGKLLRLKAGSAFDFEAAPSVTVLVTATDSNGVVYAQEVRIGVANVNEAPTNVLLSAAPVPENLAGAIVGTLTAIDPDAGNTHSFTVSDGRFEVVGNQLKLKAGQSLSYWASPTVAVDVTATDQNGLAVTRQVTFAINAIPTDIALSNATVAENANGAVVGLLTAVDPNAGNTHSYAVSDSRFEVVGNQLKLRAGQWLDFEATPSITLTVTATDQGGLSISKPFTVAVGNVNETPLDVYLSNTFIWENSAGAVVGTLSTWDPDAGNTHSYAVSDSRFEVAGNQLKLKAGQWLDFEGTPSVNLTVTSTDQGGLSVSKGFTVTVGNVNEAPLDLYLSNSWVWENSAGAVLGTLSTWDPDAGNTHSYAVSDNRFEVVGNQLKLKAGQWLDFEATPSITLTLTTTDQGGLSFGKPFTINVSNVNEAPLDIGLSNNWVAENGNGAVIGWIWTWDVDAGNTHSYTVSDGRFEVADGQLKLKAGQWLDYEAGAAINLTVTTTDQGGLSFSKPFTINVSDVNEAPLDIGLTNNWVSENSAGAAIAWLWTWDVDAGNTHSYAVSDGRFEIVGNLLQLKSGQWLDYEAASAVNLTVTTTDQGGLSFSKPFTINVSNVNEAPYDIWLSNAWFWEKTDGAVVGTLAAWDVDYGNTHSYAVSDSRFEVAGNQLKLKAGQWFDYASTQAVNLTVTATDQGGLAVAKGFTVYVGDINEAPVDIYLSNAWVSENSDGAIIGTLSTWEWDINNTHTYAVSDGRFEVSGNQLKLKAGQWLDFEGTPSVNLTVTSTDQGGLSVGKGFTVTVGNVNEAPNGISFSNWWVAENSVGAVFANVTTWDPDAGSVHSYAITDGRFEIVNNQLKLKDGYWLDYESGPTINMWVTATDQGGLSFSAPLTVYVSDVNEAPTDIILNPYLGSTSYIWINEGGGAVGMLATVDPDVSYPYTYSYSVSDYRFEVVNGQLQMRPGYDLVSEYNPTITIWVTGYDYGGLSYTKPFTMGIQRNWYPTGQAVSPEEEELAAGGLEETSSARGVDAPDPSAGPGDDVLTGTAGNDEMEGRSGNDTLDGGAGDDFLLGGAGDDRLRGGAGADVYAFVRDDGNDTVEADSSDMILFGTGIARDQLWFARSDSDLVVSVIGQDQTVTVEGWFASPDNRAAKVWTNEGDWVTNDGVDQLVQAMASFAPPASGQTTLPPSLAANLAPALATNWQHA